MAGLPRAAAVRGLGNRTGLRGRQHQGRKASRRLRELRAGARKPGVAGGRGCRGLQGTPQKPRPGHARLESAADRPGLRGPRRCTFLQPFASCVRPRAHVLRRWFPDGNAGLDRWPKKVQSLCGEASCCRERTQKRHHGLNKAKKMSLSRNSSQVKAHTSVPSCLQLQAGKDQLGGQSCNIPGLKALRVHAWCGSQKVLPRRSPQTSRTQGPMCLA